MGQRGGLTVLCLRSYARRRAAVLPREEQAVLHRLAYEVVVISPTAGRQCATGLILAQR